jgi:hypothetical protein
MNVHDRIDELASLAVAGALDPAEQKALEAHAAACPDCAAVLRESRDFHAWMKGAVSPDRPPAGLELRIVTRLGGPGKTRLRLVPRGRFWRWAAGLVAAVGLVFVGSSFSDGAASLRTIASAESDWRDVDGDDVGVDRVVRAVSDGISLDRLRAGIAGDHKLDDALKPTFAVENDNKAGPSVWATFKDGNRDPMTKMEADVQVLNRQNEVQLAELQKAQGQVEEYRAKLAKVVNEKANTATFTLNEPLGPNEFPGVEAGGALKMEFELRADGGPQVQTAAVKMDPLPVQAAQKLVRNAKLGLEVASYDETQTRLAAVVTEEKGYVAGTAVERMRNGKVKATVEVRVPSERFDAVVAKLRALGTVLNQSVQVEDMTKAYADVETRLAAKSAFLERLRKLLAEGKGDVKQLLEVEVQMGATLEEIDRMKGELRFYDNRITLSTITLEIAEKDLGRPFELVETLQAKVGLVAADVDAVHAAAQKVFLDAGGRVLDVKIARQNDGSAQGTLQGRVDAAKFPAVREALRKLGHPETDTVERRKTGKGGTPKADAPVRVEEATVDVTVASPPEHVARRAALTVEAADVEAAYAAARKAIEAGGGRVTEGQLVRRADGLQALVRGRLDADRHAAALETIRALGKPKQQSASQSLPPAGAFVRERGDVEVLIHTPPVLIGEEQGLGKAVRDTFTRSVGGVLWSVEKLFVGAALAGPWLLLAAAAWLVWRRRRKATA